MSEYHKKFKGFIATGHYYDPFLLYKTYVEIVEPNMEKAEDEKYKHKYNLIKE